MQKNSITQEGNHVKKSVEVRNIGEVNEMIGTRETIKLLDVLEAVEIPEHFRSRFLAQAKMCFGRERRYITRRDGDKVLFIRMQ